MTISCFHIKFKEHALKPVGSRPNYSYVGLLQTIQSLKLFGVNLINIEVTCATLHPIMGSYLFGDSETSYNLALTSKPTVNS